MGLDMYLTGEKSIYDEMEDGFRVEKKELAIAYWRKHPNLHGYIVQTFCEGKDECQKVHLKIEDLQNIIAAVREKRLPHTDGFFFGKSELTEAEQAEDIAFLEGAVRWLSESGKNEHRAVFYQASW